MTRYLIYNNIVCGAGITHAWTCYNYAIECALENNMTLIVPPVILGHKLNNEFEFEDFFGFNKYTRDQIQDILNKTPSSHLKIVEYNSKNNPINMSILKTKSFLLNCYLKSTFKKYCSHLVENKTNIAIHIRRGDIIRESLRWKERIVPDLWFKNTLNNIVKFKKINLENAQINIYSEADENGIYFNENNKPINIKDIFDYNNCSYYLNTNIYEAMANMMNSDIFIASKYGFGNSLTPYREWMARESFIYNWDPNNVFIRNNKFSYTKTI